MKNLAVLSVQYWHYSFDYFLDSMARCGISNIELWPGEPHYYRGDYRTGAQAAKRIRELKAKLDSYGMKVVMYTPETLGYPYNPAGKDEGCRGRTLDMYKYAIEDLLEFGTNQLFCNSGYGLRDEPRQEAWNRAVDTFQQTCDYAAKMGVCVNLEQLQPYESNLVLNSADMQKILSDVGAPNMYCCLDIGAMAVAGESIQDFYSRIPDKINHVHFSDANHEVPGDRGLPLKGYLEEFEKQGYEGYLSLEVNDTIYIENPHEAFKRAADYMRGLLPEA